MDKGAIVTGGSRGIGAAIVAALHNAGYRVLTCGRGARPSDLPTPVHWMSADVSKPADAAALVDYASAELGPMTLLVNNAGVQVEKNDWREHRRRLGFGRRYQLSRRIQHVPRGIARNAGTRRIDCEHWIDFGQRGRPLNGAI